MKFHLSVGVLTSRISLLASVWLVKTPPIRGKFHLSAGDLTSRISLLASVWLVKTLTNRGKKTIERIYCWPKKNKSGWFAMPNQVGIVGWAGIHLSAGVLSALVGHFRPTIYW